MFRSLYESEDYVHENLAVFDAAYIEECVHLGRREGTDASRFILPPPDLQDCKFLSVIFVCFK